MRLTVILSLLFIIIATSAAAEGNFETLFDGHGDIMSYIYFRQDAKYFIDTELNGSVETFRYKRFYLLVDLFKETHMGRKYGSNMVFDPTRAHWSFGLTGRLEWSAYFVEGQMHHDCFHDIDRWLDNSIYWNSPRLGFGSIGYLPKYKYHQPKSGGQGFFLKNKLDYFFLLGFYAPKGTSFQKGHDYQTTLNTNFRFDFARYGQLGLDVESNNLWVLNRNDELRRQHMFSLNTTIYGDRGALVIFLRVWPYDDQSIRSRADHKFAFGMHLGF